MRRLKAWQIMRKREAIKARGLDLLKVLQSEITHELSSPCFQTSSSGSPGDFTVEWDGPHSQDVVLRKKCDTGEEVAISAMLGSRGDRWDIYPMVVNMKVCIKKPGLTSLLQFDCEVNHSSYTGYDFNIDSARYLTSTSSTGLKYYTGPVFSDLDPELQAAFKKYLQARGIEPTFLNFLKQHMHKKEETQYLNWLKKLQQTVS